MSKIKNILFLTVCLGIISPAMSMDAEIPLVYSQNITKKPTTIASFQKEHAPIIAQLREGYRANGTLFFTEHQDFLVPIAQKLEAFVASCCEKFDRESEAFASLNRLITLIQGDIESQLVSAYGLEYRYSMALALLGEPTAREWDLFAHVNLQNSFAELKAGFEKNSMGHWVGWNREQYLEKVDDLLSSGEMPQLLDSYYYSGIISNSIFCDINNELRQRLDVSVTYPIFGETLFNPKLLIDCLLNEIYLVGVGNETQSNVHGVDVTPVGFAFHDDLHKLLDQRRYALKSYINDVLNYHVGEKDAWAEDIYKDVVAMASEKYTLLMDSIKELNHGIQHDKKAVAGLFFIVHEFTDWANSNIFIKKDIKDVLTHMKYSVSDALSQWNSWNNSVDVLVTNPVDGITSLTDDEIKDRAWDQLMQSKNSSFHLTPEEWDGRKVRMTVTHSMDFIDVLIKNKTGNSNTVSFPTNKRKWDNFHTYEGMLRYAGTGLNQPEFGNTLRDNRNTASNFLKDVNAAIMDTVSHFIDAAHEYIELNPRVAEDYTNRMVELSAIWDRPESPIPPMD